jgi:two-component system response regulator NreC
MNPDGQPSEQDEFNDESAALSSRQIEILKLWGDGLTNQEIADKLFISVRTVETHKNHIMQKLNLKSSVDLMKFAIRNNIISI